MLFDSSASHLFIATSVVIELGLEVEALEEPLYVSSPLGIRARIGMICRGCELEISGTLLTVDLRIMDMSEFDVILGMDWLTAYKVIIDCEHRGLPPTHRMVLVLYFRGTSMIFFPRRCRSPGVRDSWRVEASLTIEDELIPDLDLPRAVCEYEDVFPD